MKKILIATSALAFAGSAFAADVSGYVVTAYKTVGNGVADDKTSGQYNESEIYASGSKTASNGLTFGATYLLGTYGSAGGGTSADTTTATAAIAATTKVTRNDYTGVNVFVSGSFGKVQAGRHNVASRTNGANSIFVGYSNGGYDGFNHGTRVKSSNAITFTSPSVKGAQFAYTMELANAAASTKTKGASSLGANYSTSVAGLGVSVAFGSYTAPTSGDDKAVTNSAYGIKVTKDKFAFSFTMGSDSEDTKTSTSRIGLGYTAGKIGIATVIGSSQLKDGDKISTTVLSANYAVASGLSLWVENKGISGNVKETDNTKTLWIGTMISF